MTMWSCLKCVLIKIYSETRVYFVLARILKLFRMVDEDEVISMTVLSRSRVLFFVCVVWVIFNQNTYRANSQEAQSDEEAQVRVFILFWISVLSSNMFILPEVYILWTNFHHWRWLRAYVNVETCLGNIRYMQTFRQFSIKI